MKKFISPTLLTVLFSLLSSSSLLAAEAEGSGSPFLDFIFKVINFSILFGVLYYFARKPVAAALQNSAKTTKTNLDEIREGQEKAKAELEDFKQKLANMKQEASEMIAKAKKEAEEEKERIIAEGEEIAKKLQEQARVSIEQEYRKAEIELKEWTAKQVVSLAEEQIQKDIKRPHYQNLVKNYLDKLN